MATKTLIRHVCDKCGNFEEKETDVATWYPRDFNHISLGQTGATIDLCADCNHQLVIFLEMDGATNMKLACINEREVL